MVKKIVAKRDINKTVSVLRSSKILINDGDAAGGGGADDEADDDASLFRFGDDSELAETSSTRTIVCICLF